MLDLRIDRGTLIDGTGAPGRRADVGVRGGRVVALGRIDEGARRRIDAEGRVVCPGFVDLHTHYDAQVFWDPTLSPSPLHGVTSVIGGNCGFSIAPLPDEPGDYLMRMLARVEGMPLESLAAGVPWNWRSFGEYLERVEGRLAVNAGFLVGHSALRCAAMGARAVGEPARPADVEAMQALLARSLAEGGLGFSSSWAATHNDGDGRPVPSRAAGREELVALASVLREAPGTSLEFIPGVGRFSDEQIEVMTEMSLAAGRPLNWNMLVVAAYAPEAHLAQLAASDHAAARGARVVALSVPQPITLRLNFVSAFVLDALPGWAEVVTLPLPARKRALADPAVRARLEEGARNAGVMSFIARWEHFAIEETWSPETAPLRGRTVGDVAKERGVSPFDAMLDVALADDLRTSFRPALGGDDDATWKLRAQVWRDPRVLVGASDAGAHLDMIDSFVLTTAFLGTAVRERGLLPLEEAIHQLTERPARLYGLTDRGRVAEGARADLVVFDPAAIAPGPIHTRRDLPAGAARLFAEAEGIEHVFVDGVEVVRGKSFTGATPGSVLRSGRDTEAVSIPALDASAPSS
jgi:N-acyl-D-aspartate/D-glutamate deacylase